MTISYAVALYLGGNGHDLRRAEHLAETLVLGEVEGRLRPS